MLNKIDIHPIYIEPFHVDFTGRVFMGVLGNHLLNAAGNHSQKRGWGIGALNETHHTWVLSRLSIEMMEMPRNYQHCQVRTWVESVMKLFTTRNFAIEDAEGRPMGYARSVWAMIDMETRRPCDLLNLYDQLYSYSGPYKGNPYVDYLPRSEFILPQSGSFLLTEDDPAGLSDTELLLAESEIYARHGLAFEDTHLLHYFMECSWYTVEVAPTHSNLIRLSNIEKANVELIKKYRASH